MTAARFVLVLVVGLGAGCNALTGVNDLEVQEDAGATGGSGGTEGDASAGASGTGGATGGTGGATGGTGGATGGTGGATGGTGGATGGTGGATGGTGGATGGTGGATGGTGGATGGTGGSGPCESDQKLCGTLCQSVADPMVGCAAEECSPCALPSTMVHVCTTAGECSVSQCMGAYLDCNDDPGCETLEDDDNPCTYNDCARTSVPENEPCPAGFCNGSGQCVECVEDTTRCQGTNIEMCTGGQWTVHDTCGQTTPYCDQGACFGVLDLVAGDNHACALLGSGRVMCWGDNSAGQLGDGNNHPGNSSDPIPATIEGVLRLAAGGSHTCALTHLGKVMCWGANSHGQLGRGSLAIDLVARSTPTEVDSTLVFEKLEAGGAFTCASSGNDQYCWGKNDKYELGLGQAAGTSDVLAPGSPVTLPSGHALMGFSAGAEHACAVVSDSPQNSVYCWGSNASAQVGVSGGGLIATPAEVVMPADTHPTVVTAGGWHTCVAGASGILCWGANGVGQLGRGGATTGPQYQAGLVVTLNASSVNYLSAGGMHTCSPTTTEGALRCWGLNASGQLGFTSANVSVTVPGEVEFPAGVNGVFSVASGGRRGSGEGVDTVRGHTCAVGRDNLVRCWGANEYGQLGDGSNVDSTAPVRVKL